VYKDFIFIYILTSIYFKVLRKVENTSFKKTQDSKGGTSQGNYESEIKSSQIYKKL